MLHQQIFFEYFFEVENFWLKSLKYFYSLKMPIIIVPVVRLGSLLFSLFMRFISIFMVISLRKQTHACFQHHFLDKVLKNELFCQSGSKVLPSTTNHQIIYRNLTKSWASFARTNLPIALMADKCGYLGSANPFLVGYLLMLTRSHARPGFQLLPLFNSSFQL